MISFVNFVIGKAQLVVFDRSNKFVATDVGMDGCLLDEKFSYNMLGLSFACKC